MSFDVSDDELERQLTTMLQERAGSVTSRVPVDRRVITRARRRRTMKFASLGSGAALTVAIVVVAALSIGSSPFSASRNEPASHGPAVRLTAPPAPAPAVSAPERPSFWSTLPPAPIGPRAAAASAYVDGTFLIFGGEASDGSRPMSGAWLDTTSDVWHDIAPSPLPAPQYPANQHFIVAQPMGDSVIIVSDGAVARYWPRAQRWERLPRVPLIGLDNLALTDSTSMHAVVLTGIGHSRGPAYAALTFDHNLASPRWSSGGSLTGRSAGRPVLHGDHLITLVKVDGQLRLDDARIDSNAAERAVPTTLPAHFVARIWTGTEMLGSDEFSWPNTDIFAFDPSTGAVRQASEAFNTCTALHAWTGKYAVSWGVTPCASNRLQVAFDPAKDVIIGVPDSPLAARRAAEYAAAPDGRLFVWGGVLEGSSTHLSDGAVLNLR